MSDLAAALDTFDGFNKWMVAETSPNSVEEITLTEAMRTLATAAKERLRLSKVPCETCGGTGIAGVYSHTDKGTGEHQGDEPIKCPACNGSGEVWPIELVEVVQNASQGLYVGEARSVLDAVESWMEAGE